MSTPARFDMRGPCPTCGRLWSMSLECETVADMVRPHLLEVARDRFAAGVTACKHEAEAAVTSGGAA